MKQKMENFKEKLTDKGYKITSQRKLVLDIFLDNKGKHLSAEEVYAIVKKKQPDIGLATVYRTLELFVELNLLQRNDFGDGRGRYELFETEVHHHHHLICLNCGTVSEFNDDLLEALENAVERDNDFHIVDHQLKFFGYCKECHKEAPTHECF